MKKIIILVLFASLLISCQQIPEDLSGSWIITEIIHNGKVVKPKTITENKINIQLKLEGFEDKECVIFSKRDNSSILPGIDSDRIRATYKRTSDSISFEVDDKLYFHSQFQKAKSIYIDTYQIVLGKEKGEIELISPKTIIFLINQEVIIEKITDEIFNQF